MLRPARRFLRRSAVLGFALVLLAQFAGQAPTFASNDQQQLDATRQALAAIQKKLAAARGQAADIQSQVKALDSQIATLNRQIGVQTQSVYQLKATIDTDNAKLAQLQSQYAGAHQAADARARAIYMAGPASTLSSLLSSSSLGDFVQKTAVWEVAANLDAKVIVTSARLRDALNLDTQELEASKATLVAKEGNLAAQGDLLNAARGQRAAALDAVNAEIASEMKNEQQLQATSQALTAALATSSQVSHSSGTGPVSVSGLIWPVRGPITSPYGPRWGGFHYGIDIGAPTGTPIHAPKDGTVVSVNCGSGYGICTIIDHGGGLTTLYAHQSRQLVRGGHVSQGQVIGYVGCTGFCTGPHLHFEVRIDGTPHNPIQYLP